MKCHAVSGGKCQTSPRDVTTSLIIEKTVAVVGVGFLFPSSKLAVFIFLYFEMIQFKDLSVHNIH